jgi:glycosyltransferase involved in cell wall biosynthesis
MQVLTFGAINRNKCAAEVIQAIGGDAALRNSVEYRLAGSIEDSEREFLLALADSKGVRLTVLGPVSSVDLAHELDEADVIACLRHPSIEAASASAIEAMLTAKAVIVADTGFYASLPSDSVLHVRPEDLVGDVRRALHRVRDEPELATQLGERARDYARATFRADNYAAHLTAMCELASRGRPLLSAVRATTERLGAWGMPVDSELLASSREVLDFFVRPTSLTLRHESDG